MDENKINSMKIAVVGVGAIFSGAHNAHEFWREICLGKDLITEIPETHWEISDYYNKDPKVQDKTYCRRGSFLPYIEFDPIEWGIPPNNILNTDTSQLLALIVAKETLKDAFHGSFYGVDLSRASVILGATCMQELIPPMASRLYRPIWAKAMREYGVPETEINAICERIASHLPPWQESTFPGLLMNVISGRIANRFNFGGTNCTTDAACASSLAALSMSVNELLLHQADLVVTGGVDTLNDICTFMCFSKTPALSPTEDCRPFSSKADGTLLAEGLGLFALKRLDDAERDGNRIYAVIRGVGSSSDGRVKSIYAPVAQGQSVAVQNAYAMAGYSPRTVDLVEAHGTGTKAGDTAEFQGIKAIFEQADKNQKQWCALGSVKSQIGHAKGAAGAAGLFKVIMALHHKVLPPTIKVEKPNPTLSIETSPFYLNTRTRPWIKKMGETRRASVSSFGFGGTNFHITLEEYNGPGKKAYHVNATDEHLILISSNTKEVLLQRCQQLLEESNNFDSTYIPYCARHSYQSFHHDEQFRLGLLVTNETDLNLTMNKIIDHLKKNEFTKLNDEKIYFSHNSQSGKLAYLFSGVGSQYLYMGSELAMVFEPYRKVWDEAAGIKLDTSKSLHEVVYPKPAFSEDEKIQLENQLNDNIWAHPAVAATSFSQLAILEQLGIRPDYLGGHDLGELVALAYSGAFDFETLLKIVRKRGELMVGPHPKENNSALKLHLFMEEMPFRKLNLPVYSNLTANLHQQAEMTIKEEISKALENPAQFRKIIEAMYAAGVRTFLEIGPGTLLTNLVRSTLSDKDIQVASIDAKNEDGITSLWKAVGKLAVAGVAINFENMLSDFGLPPEPESKESKKHKILLNGANPKPYVPPLDKETASSHKVMDSEEIHQHAQPSPEINLALTPEDSTMPSNIDTNLLTTLYGQLEENVLKAHETYQKAAAESHIAFLHATEKILHEIKENGLGNTKDTPQVAVNTVEPVHANHAKENDRANTSIKIIEQEQIAKSFVATESINQQYAPTDSSTDDIPTKILAIIAAETAYPIDMLSAEMDIEADLGIDSIKRVEILSAIKSKYPNLPELDPMQVANLKTIRDLQEFFTVLQPTMVSVNNNTMKSNVTKETSREEVMTVTPQIENKITNKTDNNSDAASDNMNADILDIIAQQTGYPMEMLSLSMDMEADLGIDSIKRIEILSTIKEKYPQLPEFDPLQLANLKTLQQLQDFINNSPGLEEVPPIQNLKKTIDSGTQFPARMVQTVRPRQLTGQETPGLREGLTVIIKDQQGISTALVNALQDHGIKAQEIADVSMVIEKVNCIIHLGALKNFKVPNEAIKANLEAFEIAKNAAKQLSTTGGTFVIVQSSGGDFGLSAANVSQALSAGLVGLARTARLEWEKAFVKAIDIEDIRQKPDEIAKLLTTELLHGGTDNEIGIRKDGTRVALVNDYEAYLPDAPLDLSPGSLLLVSGGARGITACCIEALAAKRKINFVLFGRTILSKEPDYTQTAQNKAELKEKIYQHAKAQNEAISPRDLEKRVAEILANREVNATMESIKTKGSEVTYYTADINNIKSMNKMLVDIRSKYKKIDGIIHGAGVIHDKLIEQKTTEQFEQVFNPKVRGVNLLLKLLKDEPLRLICLFSSVVAGHGNKGQSDYAMANQVLNAVASAERNRRGSNCLVKSINWGPWENGMVNPGLKKQFEENGIYLLSREQGAELFLKELSQSNPTVVTLGHGLVEPSHNHAISNSDQKQEFVVITPAKYAYLLSHRIKGNIVVPVCQVIEWFMPKVKINSSEKNPITLSDLRVIRGIRLPKLEDHKFEMILKPKQDSSRDLKIEIKNSKNELSYSADAKISDNTNDDSFIPITLEKNSNNWPWKIEDCYADSTKSFHGPDFYFVDSLDTYGERTASATLKGIRHFVWPEREWVTDPGIIDGSFQVASLFGQKIFGKISIPMKVNELILYKKGAIDEPVTCLLQLISNDVYRAKYNIMIVRNKELILAIKGLEMVVMP